VEETSRVTFKKEVDTAKEEEEEEEEVKKLEF
jgi:hypothetical protein